MVADAVDLARALLIGIVRELHAAYREAVVLGTGERPILVGFGNGVRRNRVLRRELARRFGSDPLLGTANTRTSPPPAPQYSANRRLVPVHGGIGV